MLFNGLWNLPAQQKFSVIKSSENILNDINLLYNHQAVFPQNIFMPSERLPKPIPIYPIKPCREFDAGPSDTPLDLSSTHSLKYEDNNFIQTTNIMPLCLKPKISQYKIIKAKKTNKKSKSLYCKSSSIVSSSKNSACKTSNGGGRLSYPREFKLMVIEHYVVQGQNKYRTCKEFQITKSMLNGWLQKAEKIQNSRPGALKSGRSGRKPQFPEIEEQLFRLYETEKSQNGNLKISNRWIRETAKELARTQCLKNELSGGMCQFSERWLTNFKKRYGIPTNWNITYRKEAKNTMLRQSLSPSKTKDCFSPATESDTSKKNLS